jgi:spermidine synthase
MPSTAQEPSRLTPVAGIAAITALSLFSFVLFKVMSFFITPANVVLCFLLAGHPLGVVLAERRYVERDRAALRDAALAMVWSIIALAIAKHIHPGLGPAWVGGGFPLGRVLIFVIVAAAMHGPFFLFTGVVDLLVLRAGRTGSGTTAPSYARLLLGAVFGLIIGFGLLSTVGAVGLVAASFALILAALRQRALTALALVAVVASALFPRIDAAWIASIQPQSPFSASGLLARGSKLLYARWDRVAYTQLIERGDSVVGAYDNIVYWDVPQGLDPVAILAKASGGSKGRALAEDAVIFSVLPPNARVAIVGAGGGRQVQQALGAAGELRVEAFEINATVVDYFQRIDPSGNASAFVTPRVQVFGTEGRTGIAARPGQFDCIYLPEAGTALGYYRALAVDPLFLHTKEAYGEYVARLRVGGVVAAAFARPADPDGHVSARVLYALRQLGLDVRTLANERWSLLIAARPGEATTLLDRAVVAAERAGLVVHDFDVANVARGATDEFGFTMPYFLYRSLPRLPYFFAVVLGAIVLIGAMLAVWLRARAQRAGIGRDGLLARLAVAFALGLSFVVVENAIVLQLARATRNMTDAVIVGSAFFLVGAALGARLSPVVRRPVAYAALVIAVVALVTVSRFHASPTIVVAASLPIAMLSGVFFPRLLEASPVAATRHLYALDGTGALAATAIVFFTPFLYGITALVSIAAVAAVVAGGAALYLRTDQDRGAVVSTSVRRSTG